VSQALDINLQGQLISLHNAAHQLIRIETKRLKIHPPENSHHESDVMDTDNVDGDTPMDDAHNVSNGVHTEANVSNQEIRKALFQVTADGYVFSEMSKKLHWAGESSNSPTLRKLTHDVHSM
jgi:hypothetical protein